MIVGGGLAAVSAVEGIREVDGDGAIALLCEEPDPPYHRPPLSKEFLQAPGAPRDLLHVKPARWYEAQGGLSLLTGTRAVALDADARTVDTEGGDRLRGRRILLATGGRPRRLEAPGSDLAGIKTLRTATDAERLRAAAGAAGSKGGRAVLVGAGFIGMELASSLTKLGLDVTVVDAVERVWPAVFPTEVSAFIRRRCEEHGVVFRLGAAATSFVGEERLAGVALASGETLPADLAVVGIGMTPSEELAAGAGIRREDGIVVDALGRTSAPGVYAAGDVARFPDPVAGDMVRIEHWDHARAHGRHAGRSMAGSEAPFAHLSYFFTHVFDLSLNVVGETARPDRVLVEGELEGASGVGPAVLRCVADDRVVGAIMINAPRELEACRTLVRERPRAKLGREGVLTGRGVT